MVFSVQFWIGVFVISWPLYVTGEPMLIGNMTAYAHGINTAQVYLVDQKTLMLAKFNYRGDGPDAWFLVGKDGDFTSEHPNRSLTYDYIIPDENGKCSKPGKYDQKDVTLKLPGKMKMTEIKYFALYCIRFDHNLGFIGIPANSSKADPSTEKGPAPCQYFGGYLNPAPMIRAKVTNMLLFGMLLLGLNAGSAL